MKALKVLLLLAAVFALLKNARSQDLIYKKDKNIIVAKILELGADEIKYRLFNGTDSLVYGIAKMDVIKVKMESGKILYLQTDMENASLYGGDKKNLIKTDFLAPVFGQLTLAFERSIKPGSSMQFDLVIPGIGSNVYHPNVTISGALLRFGYKFISTPDFAVRGMRYSHLLKGGYIEPQIIYGAYAETFHYTNYYYGSTGTSSRTQQTSTGAVMLNFGKQWIMSNVFAVDLFWGLGYGLSSKTSRYSNGYSDVSTFYTNYAYLGPFSNFPLAVQMGLKVGVLVK
jgi:hypothetical protein